MPKKETYNNESIIALKGAERVRQRPAAILGSDGLEGCQHTFVEILANSIDEAREGYGKVIDVTRYKDKSIRVRDYGRGCPVDWNEKEGRYNWELVYCELYAGGKYENNTVGENYEFSLGLNGLGCCATQYSSEFMDVTVYKDGFKYDLHFEKGENVGGLKKEPFNYKQSGTDQHWRPDLEVFTDINIPLEFFLSILKKQAVVNSGITFRLFDEESGEKYEFFYENGIADYMREISGDTAFTPIMQYSTETKGRDRADSPEYKLKMEFAFCFNNNVNLLEYYHNSSHLENGGAPEKAVKAAFTAEIDKYIRNAGKYSKNESKIAFQDIQDSLIVVTNSSSTKTSYEHQTKKAITNPFIQTAMTEFIKSRLEVYFIENKQDAEKIVDQVLVNKRSRESAERERLNTKKKLTGSVDINNRVKKFVDCESKDVSMRELYIVEGDSALGSVKLGRDASFQAIMPVRGKILNCLKVGLDRIFASEIITDLIKVLGCGVETDGKKAKGASAFDLDALRWSKVIICTDADVDGYQIRTLILAMIYRLCPTLIKEGKVFIAESPLFEIVAGGKSYFAYNEAEKTAILSDIRGKYTIQRSKGLGENEPEMMWETTMNPRTRRLIKVMPEDAEETKYYFDVLLGDDEQERKRYIEMFGHLYMDDLDVD
ncbi:MAG: DNA topoisomerase [Clostridia bacterium]|nr:DNA topoisomerase [Clostridia bacterium]